MVQSDQMMSIYLTMLHVYHGDKMGYKIQAAAKVYFILMVH